MQPQIRGAGFFILVKRLLGVSHSIMIKISDIATSLGLSRVTVSAILNNRYAKVGISEETAQRVREQATTMGYLPNQNALSMKTGRSLTIGMLSSSLSEEWGGKILEGALDAIQDSLYSLRIEAVHGEAEERLALERLLGSRIEGLFCCNINPIAKTNEFFNLATERYGVVVASTNCSFSFPHARVESDNSAAVLALLEHLVQLGHRRIAHIAGGHISEVSRERREAFQQGVESFQLNPEQCPVVFSDWEMDQSRSLARELLDQRSSPTAIVCANDLIAACVLQVATERGIKVPEDLSVVGMTNERISCLTTPDITTVHSPWEDIGRAGIMALIESIERKSQRAPDTIVRFPCTTILRGSSGINRASVPLVSPS